MLASVLVTQDGLAPQKQEKAMMKEWRVIGAIAAEDEEKLSLAVAKQRDLIEAWACAFVHDFRTDEFPLLTGPGAPPIRVGWALPPTTLKNPPWVGWPAEGQITEVPPELTRACADESLRCGFMGNQCFSRKGEKGGFRFVQVELPN